MLLVQTSENQVTENLHTLTDQRENFYKLIILGAWDTRYS